jgi:tripartite-type tricarboxylate transporter receptor subunit TctC
MRKTLQAVLFTLAITPLLVLAQNYPDKPVKMIVPYPAGGPADQIARELANGLSQALGQTFVIETKGGGSGSIGTGFVAKAAPDGYTLLAGSGAPHTAVPVFNSNPPYDGIKEFLPILMIIDVPNVMVIGPHIKATNVKEFIELAKTRTLTYGSSGTGSSTHIAGEIFQIEAKVKMTHVPYKGATPVVNDMLGGHVDVSFLNLSAMLPHIRSGKLRAIGLSSQTRAKALPDIPTLGEQGVPDNTGSWYGLLAPAGTPESVVRVLYDASMKYFSQPEVRARVEASGSELKMLNPQQFLAALTEEKRQLTELNKILNIKMD